MLFLFPVFRALILIASFAPVDTPLSNDGVPPLLYDGVTTGLSVSRWGSSPSTALSVARWGSTPSYEVSTARVGSTPSVALSIVSQVADSGSTPLQRSTCSSYGTLLPFFVACVLAAFSLLVFVVLARHAASVFVPESQAQPVPAPARRRTPKFDPPEVPLPEVPLAVPVVKAKKIRKRVRGGLKNKH